MGAERKTPSNHMESARRQSVGTTTRMLSCRSRSPLKSDLLKYLERVTGIEPAWPAWKAGHCRAAGQVIKQGARVAA